MAKSAPAKVEKEKVLMLVKAYPDLSAKYGEIVCTAGIRLRDTSWIRIYPYPFRHVEEHYRFKKWDVIEVPLERSIQDPRPDSYKLHDVSQIKLLGHISIGDKYWTPRMRYITETAVKSVEELLTNALPSKGWGASILPVPVQQGSAKLSWQKEGEWSGEKLKILQTVRQRLKSNLFSSIKKYSPLRPKPYLFRLTFRDSLGVVYTYPILDWEIYQLYFNSRQTADSDEIALEKVRHKIEDEIFAQERETYVILGSIHQRFRQRHLFAVDGFVWPTKQQQPSLF